MKTNLRFGRLFAILLCLLMTTGVWAQLEVPTETISLTGDMAAFVVNDQTNQAAAIASGDPVDLRGQSNENGLYMIEYTSNGDYFEYQMFSPDGGSFLFNVPINSKRANAKVNVSAYELEGDFVMNGKTYAVYNNSWTSSETYKFPINLEAAKLYNVRITVVDAGCNIENGMTVTVVEGSIDASLSTITIGGEEIDGFDPEEFEYTIPLGLEDFVADIELAATANDENATFEIVAPSEEDIINNPNRGVFTITCTSESGAIASTYTVAVVKPIEVFDGMQILGNSHHFYNNGVNLRDLAKLNGFTTTDYVDYYIYSWDDINLALPLNCAMGYENSKSYVNVSVLGLNDTTWQVNDIYSQFVPTTYGADGVTPSWAEADGNILNWVVSLKAEEPVLLRIYCAAHTGSNATDFFFQPFEEITGSIDNTLSDLTVDGESVYGFDPEVTTYTLPVSAGSSSVEIGATASDAGATVDGTGTVALVPGEAVEIVVTSEAGYPLTYRLYLKAPVMVGDGDTLRLLDDMYEKSDLINELSSRPVQVSNVSINWFHHEQYVDYYIYSTETKDMHVTATTSNGNSTDSIFSHLNISTYELGTEWVLDPEKTWFVPGIFVGGWTIEYATDLEYNISLEANKAVMLRIYAETNAPGGLGDIYRLTFNDGHSDYVKVDEVIASEMKVISGISSLEVRTGDEFVGGSVQVYNMAGQLVANTAITSSISQIDNLQKGIYIVKAIDANSVVTVQKSFVH